MAGPARRPGATTLAPSFVPLLSRKTYIPGFGMPEGDYCLYFDVRMHEFLRKDGSRAGDPTLGVMLTAYNLHDLAAEPVNQFLGMGRNAHKSFMPDPNGGEGGAKRLIAVPDGPGGMTLNDQTNCAFFIKSLHDSGLPEGVFDETDLSVLDGIHVHIGLIPEPESRKAFRKSRTGENADVDEGRGPQSIPVVTEILDGGKPWEGTGGLPEQKKAAPAKPTPFRAPTKATPATAPAPPADDDLKEFALQAIAGVLETNPNGLKRLKLKTEAFKRLSAMDGVDAQAVMNGYIASDEGLKAVLADLEYELSGTGPAADVKPIG